MAKVVTETEQATTTAMPEQTNLKKLAALYDALHKYEKQTGNEKAFLAKFKSKKEFLAPFARKEPT